MKIEAVEIDRIPSELQISLPSFDLALEIPIALIAYEHDKPVGLVVASLMKKVLSAEVLHLDGIDATIIPLLETLEKLLREKQCFLVCMNYQADRNLEITLLSIGWGKPFLHLKRYVFDTTLFPKQWMKQELQWPSGFEEFRWKELTQNEEERLARRHAASSFPPSISPFPIQQSEPLNSLGLRYEDEVVGWVITERTASDTIRYNALYIHPRYRHTGLPIKLLADAINLQLEHKIRWGTFDLNAKQAGSNWTAFIQKRLAPLAQQIILFNRTWKQL